MEKILKKIISLILIINILLTGNFSVTEVLAQASTLAPAPTSEPKPTSAPAPTSAPKPTSAPSDIKPTSAPAPTLSATTPTFSQPQSTETVINGTPTSNPSPTGDLGESKTSSQQADTQTSSEIGNIQDSASGSDSSGGSVNDPANINTGPLSANYASEKNNNWQEVLNKNLAEIENKVNAVTNSGFNFANLNTLDGQILTGNSLSSINLMNKLNSNMTGLGSFSVYDIYDNLTGDIVFQLADNNVLNNFNTASSTVSKNSLTGPGSTNDALADNSFTVKEANGNDAKLVNDISLEAVTGGNSASYNTGNGSVKTGNASVLANIINLANTNLNVSQWLFGVVNIFGTLAGNIILPPDNNSSVAGIPSTLAENTKTGAFSTNNATTNNTNTENYTNDNTADIKTNLDVSANTGNNNASLNTGGVSVMTGSTEVSVNDNTVANTNSVNEDGTVWLVIVNKMGKWVGEIIGSPWGSTVASNSLPVGTLSQNSLTGPYSNNNTEYNNNDNTNAENNNTAEIINNIKLNADTGNNSSEMNTGAGSIQTGNAKAGLNLVNMVNTNVTAKKFITVLVNVLGTFMGDVVTPGEQPHATVQENNLSPPSYSMSLSISGDLENISQEYVNDQDQDQSSGNTSSNQNTSNIKEADIYQNYNNAVNNVKRARTVSRWKAKVLGQKDTLYFENKIESIRRGVFISPAFAKATETSFAGILLGGASIRVNESWLTILPVTLFVLMLRRRRKFNFTKYLNSLLEIVL